MKVSEQWSSDVDPVEVAMRGEAPVTEVVRLQHAFNRVRSRHHITAVVHVRLSAPHGADGPLLVQANTTVRGEPVRVQVAGPRGFAASFAAERLDRQLARLAGEGTARCWPDPARPPLATVTAQRPIVRHKICRLLVGTPDDAIRTMDAMDYDAFLFTDVRSGEDAIVYWAGPLGVRLVRQQRMCPLEPGRSARYTVHPHPAALLTESEAAARLCRYGLPFLFFADPRRRRGRLLYRRHDGDLAAVLPDETEVGGGTEGDPS